MNIIRQPFEDKGLCAQGEFWFTFPFVQTGGLIYKNQEMFIFFVHFIYMKLLCISTCVSLLEN